MIQVIKTFKHSDFINSKSISKLTSELSKHFDTWIHILDNLDSTPKIQRKNQFSQSFSNNYGEILFIFYISKVNKFLNKNKVFKPISKNFYDFICSKIKFSETNYSTKHIYSTLPIYLVEFTNFNLVIYGNHRVTAKLYSASDKNISYFIFPYNIAYKFIPHEYQKAIYIILHELYYAENNLDTYDNIIKNSPLYTDFSDYLDKE